MPLELRVRYSRLTGWLLIGVGASNALFQLAERSLFGALMGVVMVVLGIAMLNSTLLTVSSARVQFFSMIGRPGKSVPIHGWHDLALDGSKLIRRGDGMRIISLPKTSASARDVEALRAVLDAQRR